MLAVRDGPSVYRKAIYRAKHAIVASGSGGVDVADGMGKSGSRGSRK